MSSDESSGALAGRVAIITGAGRGIAQAVALEFASQGAGLVLASRTMSQLQEVARSCTSLGARCLTVVADVGKPADVERLVGMTMRMLGRVDILVNAAAVIGPIGPLVDTNLEEWESAVRTNLFGTVNSCRAVLGPMQSAGSGTIINFSGGGATSPLPNLSAYGVSKAAVVRFTETIAEEFGDKGVKAYAIAPGMVDTTIHDTVLQAGELAGPQFRRAADLRQGFVDGVPASHVARLALFLASDRSAGALSGRLISVSHDPWERWAVKGVDGLEGTPWYTLRRVDPHTVGSLPEPPT